MPELPEVETIVRELRAEAVNKKFGDLEIMLHSVFKTGFENPGAQLKGTRILDVTRRGKFIIFVLERDLRLVIHLRMTGRLMWKQVKAKEKFIRVIFTFSDGLRLFFSDIRKFGRVWLYHKKDYEKVTGICRLGIEPFAENFDVASLDRLLGSRKGILKNTLLRQDLIAGIGNIYADEICHYLYLHPSSRLEKIPKKYYERMHAAILHCLGEGIKHCGVSVSDFVGTRGTLGKHQHYLQVYGRKGDKCYRCSGKIMKTVVAGRGTYFCADCQKRTYK